MNFTRTSAIGNLWLEVDHERSATKGSSAPSAAQATPHCSRSPSISARTGHLGSRTGEAPCPGGPQLKRESSESLQLGRLLPAKLRPGGATRSPQGWTSQLMDCATAKGADREFGTAARSLGLPSCQLDRPVANRASRCHPRTTAVRLHR